LLGGPRAKEKRKPKEKRKSRVDVVLLDAIRATSVPDLKRDRGETTGGKIGKVERKKTRGLTSRGELPLEGSVYLAFDRNIRHQDKIKAEIQHEPKSLKTQKKLRSGRKPK